MTSSDDDSTDFRSRAVKASEARRRTLPKGLSPEKGGFSYCLEREPSLSRLRLPIKIMAVSCFVLCISAWVTSALALVIAGIGFFWKQDTFASPPTLLVIAFCCFVAGVLVGFVPLFLERGIVHRRLSQPLRDSTSESHYPGIHVSLEHAPTYGSMKILAEDVGLLYIDPEAGYLKMDGLSYEYVIHSKDVVRLSLHSNSKSVLISYMVGEEQLDLAIVPRSVQSEVERQTTGSSRSLFEAIQDALA
jgi:hypothetical protein